MRDDDAAAAAATAAAERGCSFLLNGRPRLELPPTPLSRISPLRPSTRRPRPRPTPRGPSFLPPFQFMSSESEGGRERERERAPRGNLGWILVEQRRRQLRGRRWPRRRTRNERTARTIARLTDLLPPLPPSSRVKKRARAWHAGGRRPWQPQQSPSIRSCSPSLSLGFLHGIQPPFALPEYAAPLSPSLDGRRARSVSSRAHTKR